MFGSWYLNDSFLFYYIYLGLQVLQVTPVIYSIQFLVSYFFGLLIVCTQKSIVKTNMYVLEPGYISFSRIFGASGQFWEPKPQSLPWLLSNCPFLFPGNLVI